MVREDTHNLGVLCVAEGEKGVPTWTARATLPCLVPATTRGQTWEWDEIIMVPLWRKEGFASLAKNFSWELK